jgi:exopolysaccharide biosynthesis polyprenyl glycosylphosphotransferase
MSRRHLMTLRLLTVLADGIGAALTFAVISAFRFEADPTAVWSVGIDRGIAAVLFAVTWVAVFWTVGLYRVRVRWGFIAEVADVLRGAATVGALTLALLFLLHQDNVSRIFLGLLFSTQPFVALLGRAILRRLFEARRLRGSDTNYMLVVGTGPLAQSFAAEVEAHRALGVRVVGHLTVPGEPTGRVSHPILGDVERMSSVFRQTIVDEIAVCLGTAPEVARYLEPVVAIAAQEGKTVRVPRGQEEGLLAGALQEDFNGFLVQSIVHDTQRDLERSLKRVIDVVGSIVALVVFSPLMIATAVAIRIADGSPVLFRQTRVGRHGRPFTILKFRTMVADAEEQFPSLVARSDTRGAAFKMEDDPRVTRLGRRLRKWALDELPQLINVVTGDMSLVGPRPAPPREVDRYDIWHRRRLSVRPGMTGLWQIEARFDQHFDDRAELDLRYIDHWSLWMDAAILLRTVPAVLTPRGR